MAARLFPLPLTPFERHMLDDDVPGYPMTCLMQLGFRGSLDRHVFCEVFSEVLANHPLLQARISGAESRRPQWVSDSGDANCLCWREDGGSASSEIMAGMDPTREPGFRLVVDRNGETTMMSMIFHHACCDGVGAARFLEDLLTAYHSRIVGTPAGAGVPPVEPARLRRRGSYPRMGWLPIRVAQEIRTFIKEGHHWLCHRVTPLGHPHPPPPAEIAGDDSLLDFPTHMFSETESNDLRALARQRGVTLNDLLLTALFLTLEHWNAQHAPDVVTPWLRIAVPQNLREQDDHQMPAANKVTMCFLTRTHEACRKAQTLLAGIRREMTYARHWLRGKGLLRALSLLQRIPGLEDSLLRGERSLCTAVLSNMGNFDRWFCSSLPREGRFLRCGDLRLHRVTALSPVRPKTHAAFFVASYGGQLQISMRRDARVFTKDQAQQLLDRFLEDIRSLAGKLGDPVSGTPVSGNV